MKHLTPNTSLRLATRHYLLYAPLPYCLLSSLSSFYFLTISLVSFPYCLIDFSVSLMNTLNGMGPLQRGLCQTCLGSYLTHLTLIQCTGPEYTRVYRVVLFCAVEMKLLTFSIKHLLFHQLFSQSFRGARTSLLNDYICSSVQLQQKMM